MAAWWGRRPAQPQISPQRTRNAVKRRLGIQQESIVLFKNTNYLRCVIFACTSHDFPGWLSAGASSVGGFGIVVFTAVTDPPLPELIRHSPLVTLDPCVSSPSTSIWDWPIAGRQILSHSGFVRGERPSLHPGRFGWLDSEHGAVDECFFVSWRKDRGPWVPLTLLQMGCTEYLGSHSPGRRRAFFTFQL